MPKSRMPYPPELERRIVEMVRAGRNPEGLAEKFEPNAARLVDARQPAWRSERGTQKPN